MKDFSRDRLQALVQIMPERITIGICQIIKQLLIRARERERKSVRRELEFPQ